MISYFYSIRARLLHSAIFVGAVLVTAPAYAAGTNMPWEQPLSQILDSIQGPVAKVVSVIIIIVTGLTLAFGETSGGFRRLIQIVFGLSIAFAASSFFLTFFQFGGGALV
ncbi:MAG: TrbC/VIRB2 family protein [Proteobacteria bacterium]|nr:TrbC/VIRB2 family protein [Pseudomonadota bacterium]